MAACGSTIESDEISVASIEAAIPSALAPQSADDVRDVRCPPIVVRGGPAVVCEATVGGTVIDVDVEPLGADGQVMITTDAPLLDRAAIENDVANRVVADLGTGEATAACDGPRLRVPSGGEQFQCEVVNGEGVRLGFLVELLDDAGNYRVTPE